MPKKHFFLLSMLKTVVLLSLSLYIYIYIIIIIFFFKFIFFSLLLDLSWCTFFSLESSLSLFLHYFLTYHEVPSVCVQVCSMNAFPFLMNDWPLTYVLWPVTSWFCILWFKEFCIIGWRDELNARQLFHCLFYLVLWFFRKSFMVFQRTQVF